MGTPPLTSDRTDILVATDLEFAPGDPVKVHVVHRDQRTLVTDDGMAVQRAGLSGVLKEAKRRVEQEFVVNISRRGVVSLPVVRMGPPEADVIRRIAAASLALYQEVLDLSDGSA